MPETNSIQIVRERWRLMATNDFQSVAAVLAPGFVLEWPQSTPCTASSAASAKS